MGAEQTACRRCGTCCEKGGPALHGPDIGLVRDGRLAIDDLFTIRRGEFAHNPVSGQVEPVIAEVVKLRGVGQEWRCCYYDLSTRGCMIYGHRPLACGALKCWQPEETLALVGKDLLSRLDILEDHDPLRALVLEYEGLCPCPDMSEVAERMAQRDSAFTRLLEQQVNSDLAFRDRVVKEHNLSLARELFLFGRPLFQLLQVLQRPVN